MSQVDIAGISIYRPSETAEHRIRVLAEKSLRESFEPGSYKDFKTIDAIMKHLVEFFGARFDELIPKLASRQFFDFVMFQYDQSYSLDSLEKAGKIRGEALDYWRGVGPTYRRALKYMAERTTMLAPNEFSDSTSEDLLKLLDEAVICAEELVGFCILSDQSSLFKDSTTIVINPEGTDPYIDHSISDLRIKDLVERVARHRRKRSLIYEHANYPGDLARHIVSPRKAFQRIVERAGIEDLRIHDLRRTAGSYMAIQNVSPTIIGKALGHRSMQSTAVYARLTQDPVRQALENAQAAPSDPDKLLPKKAQVKPIKRKAK